MQLLLTGGIAVAVVYFKIATPVKYAYPFAI